MLEIMLPARCRRVTQDTVDRKYRRFRAPAYFAEPIHVALQSRMGAVKELARSHREIAFAEQEHFYQGVPS